MYLDRLIQPLVIQNSPSLYGQVGIALSTLFVHCDETTQLKGPNEFINELIKEIVQDQPAGRV